jgi:hypothetical protein
MKRIETAKERGPVKVGKVPKMEQTTDRPAKGKMGHDNLEALQPYPDNMSCLVYAFKWFLRQLIWLGIFRMEKLEISRRGSQAKILGTVVAFAGATLMTLYRGTAVISLHTRSSHQHVTSSKLFLDRDSIKGSLMLGASYLSLSAFYILQVI